MYYILILMLMLDSGRDQILLLNFVQVFFILTPDVFIYESIPNTFGVRMPYDFVP